MPRKSAEEYVQAIGGLRAKFETVSPRFRAHLAAGGESEFDKFWADSVRRNTYGNALVRLRLLIENNFHVIETLGLLAVTRYIFELSIWLLLFEKDIRYCLV